MYLYKLTNQTTSLWGGFYFLIDDYRYVLYNIIMLRNINYKPASKFKGGVFMSFSKTDPSFHYPGSQQWQDWLQARAQAIGNQLSYHVDLDDIGDNSYHYYRELSGKCFVRRFVQASRQISNPQSPFKPNNIYAPAGGHFTRHTDVWAFPDNMDLQIIERCIEHDEKLFARWQKKFN